MPMVSASPAAQVQLAQLAVTPNFNPEPQGTSQAYVSNALRRSFDVKLFASWGIEKPVH